MSPSKIVTIFGSSLPGEGAAAYGEARRLGRMLAESNFAVCNGGYSGLMEASARGAREVGGHTIGVTCRIWSGSPNPWIVEEVRTGSFLERLMTLVERGDAYVVLPGGTGTLAELALIWEMMNKAALSETVGGRKPLLVTVPYWQPLIDCLGQEASLAPGPQLSPDSARSAMDHITLISSPDEAAEILGSSL